MSFFLRHIERRGKSSTGSRSCVDLATLKGTRRELRHQGSKFQRRSHANEAARWWTSSSSERFTFRLSDLRQRKPLVQPVDCSSLYNKFNEKMSVVVFLNGAGNATSYRFVSIQRLTGHIINN